MAVAGKADDADHLAAAIEATVTAFGGLDVLVNNTGINPYAGSMTGASPEVIAKTFGVNVGAALAWTGAAVAAGLGRRPGAAVVNVASVAGLRPSPPIGIYGASKAALLHATTELALELAPAIRVNAVAPAVVRPSSPACSTRAARRWRRPRTRSVASASRPMWLLRSPSWPATMRRGSQVRRWQWTEVACCGAVSPRVSVGSDCWISR